MAIRKRGRAWHVEFRYTDPSTGMAQRFRRSTGPGTSKRDALVLEREWRHEVENPRPPQPEIKRSTFSDFATYWLELRQPDWKPSTHRVYDTYVRNHLTPAFGTLDLRAIGPERVQHLKSSTVRAGLSHKSTNNLLSILSSMFRSAVAWGYAERNPVQAIKPLALPPQEVHFWDGEQAAAFLEAATRTAPGFHALFFTALRTGMRAGELFGLHWEDVDFAKRQLHVRRSWSHGQLTTPKSGKGRMLPMTDGVVRVLRDHRHLKGELVFCMPDGGFLDSNKVKHALWRSQRLAGVPRITFHDMRHSFASQLVMAGVPLRAVQELLGHSDIRTTMRYAHLAPGATARWVQVLDDPRQALATKWPQMALSAAQSGGEN